MKRGALAVIALSLLTAGIRPGSAPQVTVTQTRIAILQSVHGRATAGADSAVNRARLMQPNAILLNDDVTALQLGGYDTRALLIANYRTWIQERPYIPMYGAVNNWDYGTASVAAAAPSYAFTHQDSVDPLTDARAVIPMMDHYGNWSQDIGTIRVIALNTCFTSSGDSCEVSRRKFDPATGHGTGFGGAGNQDRAYQPADMYSNWNTVTGAGYLWLKSLIQTCTLPHIIILAPNGFYGVQGDTATSGVWCWNRAKVAMALIDSCHTALGYKVSAVLSGHQHCYYHITARNDSVITYANGGIDFINGPPCGQSHAPAIGALPDTGAVKRGNVSPDTCKVDSVDLWQNHGDTNGALLQAISGGTGSGKFKTVLTRPAWILVDASRTQLTWTVYDSSGVYDTWTRSVR